MLGERIRSVRKSLTGFQKGGEMPNGNGPNKPKSEQPKSKATWKSSIRGQSKSEGEQPESSQPKPSKIDIAVQGNQVAVQFRRPVSGVVLTSDQAAALGQALLHCAKIAAGKKLIVVPGGRE